MDTKRIYRILSDQKEEIQQKNYSSLCTRREEQQLSLSTNLAQIVIGVRRSGKSTLCEMYLAKADTNYAYVNFDDDRLANIKTEDMDSVLDALYQLYGDFDYVFFDEIQNVNNWQLFINRLLRQNKKIFITGSNSKLLSSELTTHLTGRHKKIELYPFSFAEYCDSLGTDLHSYTTKCIALRKRALLEYLKTGGFPELINEENKTDYIESLLNSIIKIDISKRFRVRYVETLKRLASTLCDNFCQEFVSSELSKKFGVSDHTIENYYSFLKEAFLLQGINKFSYKSIERVRGEKVYVVDLAFVSNRHNTFSTNNLGWRLENTIFIELLRRTRNVYSDVFYFREKQWEVDFIVTKNGNVEQLIQVSFDISNEKTLKRELTGLLKASQKFNCKNLTLINFFDEKEVTIDGLTVNIVPASEWLCGNA